MKKRFSLVSVAFLIVIGTIFFLIGRQEVSIEENEPSPEEEISLIREVDDPFGLIGWKRPDGPLRVGIQAGHWKYMEAPDEIEGVRNNGGGTSKSGVPEWQVNLMVAEEIAMILEKEGIVVDILPATVPPRYWADAFVSLHVDGNDSSLVSGYKVAAARRDMTGQAEGLSRLIEEKYGELTKLPLDSNITRTMRGYYAFSWHRYEHAIHPKTPGVIVEMGFLSNPRDARFLINNPEVPAQAVALALIAFLKPV
jgi:hypothetical protein